MCARPDDAMFKVGYSQFKTGECEAENEAGESDSDGKAAVGEAKEDITFYFWNENHYTIIQRYWQNRPM